MREDVSVAMKADDHGRQVRDPTLRKPAEAGGLSGGSAAHRRVRLATWRSAPTGARSPNGRRDVICRLAIMSLTNTDRRCSFMDKGLNHVRPFPAALP